MARTHLLPKLTAGQVAAFLAKIKFAGSNECWIYGTGKGYGAIYITDHSFRASRVSLYLFAGFDPMEKIVCHKCDNPPCVNPTHLYAGTCRDNSLDAVLRNRLHVSPRGVRSGVIRAKYIKEPLHPDYVAAAETVAK